MKNILIITVLVSSFSLFGNAQSFTKFPADCEPLSVDAATLVKNAKALQNSAGFQNIYFSKADIEDLIAHKSSVGVRFYISKTNTNQPYADVMAVGIDAQGNELSGKNLNRQYLSTIDVNTRFLYNALGVNSSTASTRVSNLEVGSPTLDYYTSYLGKDALSSLINSTGCDGVRIYPATVDVDKEEFRTMGFGAVKVDKGTINDLSNTYLLATHPCPVLCGGGGGGQYLWNE